MTAGWRDAELVAVSLFAGVGGIDLGLEQAGIPTAVQVEVDPTCRKVLGARFPDAVRFGDVREVTGEQIREVVGGRRLVVAGGWPCQDVSVAGRRVGLGGARSGLFREFMRLVSETRPDWVVAENVPGLLSAVCTCPGDGTCRATGSVRRGACPGEQHPVPGGACAGGCMARHGGAMGAVVGVLGELGYGWAYRVLDARHLGVAQRRRRVFIVGRAGDRAAPVSVLLEPEGVRGDPPQGGPPRPRFASGPARAAVRAGAAGVDGAGGGGARADDDDDLSSTGGQRLAATLGAITGGPRQDLDGMTYVPLTNGLDDGEVARAVTAGPQGHRHDTTSTTYVVEDVASTLRASDGPHGHSWGLRGDGSDNGGRPGRGAPGRATRPPTLPRVADPNDRVTHALTSEGADASEDGTGRGTPLAVVPIGQDALRGSGEAQTPSPDAEGRVRLRDPGFGVGDDGDEAQTLTAAGPGAVATWRADVDAPVGFRADQSLSDGFASSEDSVPTLTNERMAVAFAEGSTGQAVDDVAPTLQAAQPSESSNRQIAVVASGAHTHTPTDGASPALTASKEGPPAVAYSPDEAATLTSGSHADGVNPPGRRSEDDVNLVAFGNAGYGSSVDGEVAPTLQATGQEGNQVQGVVSSVTDNGTDVYLTEEQAGALCSGGGIPGQGYQAITNTAQVRRLTPVECERLQGFPDGWTDPHGDASDSVRYRQLGNAVCVPVAGWVGWRLVAWENGWRP